MKSPFEVITKDPLELKVYKIKSSLMILIVEYKRDHKLTQKQMAKLCDVSQPRMSSIMNARFDLLSIDCLIKISLKLGIEVHTNAVGENGLSIKS